MSMILFSIAYRDIRAVFAEQIGQRQFSFPVSVGIKSQDSFAYRFLSLEYGF